MANLTAVACACGRLLTAGRPSGMVDPRWPIALSVLDRRGVLAMTADSVTPRRLTIAEIAAAAGVSVPTVSRVLNQRPDVAPATRERVQRLFAEPGYGGSRSARALRRGFTKVGE